MKCIFALVAASILNSVAIASTADQISIDGCSTNSREGQYATVALKSDERDSKKLFLIGISIEGYVDLLPGIVTSKSSVLQGGVSKTTVSAKLEDGSLVTGILLGDTEGSISRSGQFFECGD